MRIALVYYSRTGRTKEVVEYVKGRLLEKGLDLRVYELKLLKEYSKPLHLNPRLIADVIFGRLVNYVGDEGFNPEDYDLVVMGSPIWISSIVPPIKSFILKYRGLVKVPVACFTMSLIDKKYSKKFRNMLESLGYKVFMDFSVVGGVSKSRGTVELAIKEILKFVNIQS